MQENLLPFRTYTETVSLSNLAVMVSHEIRRENARALMDDECGGVLAEFARRIKRSDTQANHLIGPNPFKNIGGKLARHIESSFKKSTGWLDARHDTDAFTTAAKWVANVFDMVSPEAQENFVFMLRGHAERLDPELLESMPSFDHEGAEEGVDAINAET